MTFVLATYSIVDEDHPLVDIFHPEPLVFDDDDSDNVS
jgi:hypothetical protein